MDSREEKFACQRANITIHVIRSGYLACYFPNGFVIRTRCYSKLLMRKPPQSATQEMLPGMRVYQEEVEVAVARQVERVMAMWNAGLSGDKLFTARMLVYCGLPLKKSASMDPIVRKAQLGEDSWVRVSFIRTSKDVPLPFGADRTLIYFLTNKAVLQQTPLLRWEHANEYMHLFGMDPRSGKNYKAVQARFTRIAYMHIMVEFLDSKGQTVEPVQCAMIDRAKITAEVDGAGNWKPSKSISQMLAADQTVTFGQRFYTDLLQNPVPLPLELIRAAGKKYRVMDYMTFLYWRAFAANAPSFIPWRKLQEQFDNQDSNLRRWSENFKIAYRMMKALPDPINQIKVDIASTGLMIHPYPVGTTFFEGHPKLGFRKEKGSLGAGDSGNTPS